MKKYLKHVKKLESSFVVSKDRIKGRTFYKVLLPNGNLVEVFGMENVKKIMEINK